MRYILVDDSVAGVGGTALTLEGLIEPVKDQIRTIPTNSLTIEDIMKNLDKIWVFGNIHSLTASSSSLIATALSMVRFFKIEFDYGYCIYRGRIPHKVLGGKDCTCPKASPYQEIYNLIKHRALALFYMSEEQRVFHHEDTGVELSKSYVLSSCFTRSFYDSVASLSCRPKKNMYAIIDGQGGWHTAAKGIPEAINFATENGLPYQLLKTSSQTEMMKILSEFKGLIFQPIIHDTCPRITIEARLLGLELHINERCQHTTEDWWNSPLEEMEEYLKERPAYLWNKINDSLN